MPILPPDRPIIGSDLATLLHGSDVSLLDLMWSLGVYSPRWYELVTKKADEPIGRVTLALLIRLLDHIPEATPVPAMPPWMTFFDIVSEHGDLSYKEWGIALGTDPSAPGRWNKGKRMDPVTEHLLLAIMNLLRIDPENGIKRYLEIMDIERAARGKDADDFLRKGKWRQ